MFYMRYNPVDYVSHWFKAQTYVKAYSEMLRVVRRERFWPRVNVTPPLPPPLKTSRGRPQKMRRREIHEEATAVSQNNHKKRNSYKLSRKGTIMVCSTCKTAGHNRLTCKLPTQSNERQVE